LAIGQKGEEVMKKNIPKDEEIRKGVIGKSMGGTNFKAFISVIGGKYYTGYEVQKEMKSLDTGESFKQLVEIPGQLVEIREAKNFGEALRDTMNYGL
jgi:hypothetical protein